MALRLNLQGPAEVDALDVWHNAPISKDRLTGSPVADRDLLGGLQELVSRPDAPRRSMGTCSQKVHHLKSSLLSYFATAGGPFPLGSPLRAKFTQNDDMVSAT